MSLVKKLGIDPSKDNIEDVPVMTLGTGSISPLEMAAAYATFANGGYYRQPIAITEIDSRTGSVLYQHTDNPSQVLSTGEAAAVTDVLTGVMQGSGTGAAGALSVNQPYAGKTGTTDNTTNLWFCGYTPQLACALWTGYSAGEIPIQKYGMDLLGDSTNLPVFKKFMDTVLAGTGREEFPTGTAPTYKNNNVWKFYGTSNARKSENEGDEDKEGTTTTTTTTTETTGGDTTGGNGATGGDGATGGNGTTGGDGSGGEGGSPTPTPTPAPTPTPTPTPTPDPSTGQ